MRTMIDLFSGIGGATLALRGVATPIAYCESDPAARAVLESNMRQCLLPRAPIVPDVRTFCKVPRADVVVAGFPCIGFSTLGRRDGFVNRGSRLFFDMMRVVKAARPRIVYLENVPGILHGGTRVVARELLGQGYNVRWCTMAASSIGCPHRRKRWYCVAYKKDTDLPSESEFDDNPSSSNWALRSEPARMVTHRDATHAQRMSLLGNAMIPQAARAAWRHLSNGAWGESTETTKYCNQNAIVMRTSRKVLSGPRFPEAHEPLDLQLVFDPAAYDGAGKPRSPLISNPPLRRPLQRRLWGTPTSQTWAPVNVLTRRSMSMLPTQVRFERSTPNHLRTGSLNPTFVEWLMGFPRHWTRCSATR